MRQLSFLIIVTFFFFRAGAQTTAYGFLQLSGKTVKQDAALTWKVTGELGTSHYLLQRSADGILYHTITRIAGQPFSRKAVTEYSYTDKDAFTGGAKMLYRVVCIDQNGNASQSIILRLQYSAPERKLLIFSSANVCTGLQVNLTHNTDEGATLLITSQSGKNMFRKDIQLVNGTECINLPVSSLPAGMYVLTLDAPGLHQQQRFLKQ